MVLGVIEECDDVPVQEVVMVKKTDSASDYRFCIDARGANKGVVFTPYALPPIAEILVDSAAGCQYFVYLALIIFALIIFALIIFALIIFALIIWGLFLQTLSLAYNHIEGILNVVPDALNRQDFDESGTTVPELEDFDVQHGIALVGDTQ